MLDFQLSGIVRVQACIRSRIARRRFLYDSRLAKRDEEEVELLGNYIGNQGNEVFKSLQDQKEHDIMREQNSRVWFVSDINIFTELKTTFWTCTKNYQE